jgi:chromosome segregation ATPase
MTEKVTAEEMLQTLGWFLIRKPKGILLLVGFVMAIVGILYFSSIRAQNSILIDSLKVLGSTAQITETIAKKAKEIEAKAESASKDIDERVARLEEVEKRFLAKREEIKRLREEQDALLKELGEKLEDANQKLDRIDAQQAETNKQQKNLMMIYEKNLNTGVQREPGIKAMPPR